MSKSKSLMLATSLLVIAALTGCGNKKSSNSSEGEVSNSGSNVNTTSENTSVDQGLDIVAGQQIYDKTLVYDQSVTPYNVAVRISETKKVVSAQSGRNTTEAGEVSSKDGVVNFAGSFLSKLGQGERTILLTFADETVLQVDAFIATKVIKTAADFQSINENLSGTYILNNDIDLSTIANFEPLGYYLDETNPKNEYFHGILEGNGYSVKNAKVFYNGTVENNIDVYQGFGLFTHEAHQAGDNIGLFQVIGSSGVVRNVVFDNIRVRGRTIVGVIAGNVMGSVYNCIVTSSSGVQMSTHFYDNDCNAGIAFGIVAGSGIVENVITLSSTISLPDIYKDWGEDYIGKIGNGWDHPATVTTDAWWQFANVNRPKMNYSGGTVTDSGTKEVDSNGSASNGIYSFAGKVWGTVRNSYGLSFTVSPFEGAARTVNFAQTHLGSLKPTSGADNLGLIENCSVKTNTELRDASLYEQFDQDVFNIRDGYIPTLTYPLISYQLAA